jgi:hypothetical protein
VTPVGFLSLYARGAEKVLESVVWAYRICAFDGLPVCFVSDAV